MLLNLVFTFVIYSNLIKQKSKMNLSRKINGKLQIDFLIILVECHRLRVFEWINVF